MYHEVWDEKHYKFGSVKGLQNVDWDDYLQKEVSRHQPREKWLTRTLCAIIPAGLLFGLFVYCSLFYSN